MQGMGQNDPGYLVVMLEIYHYTIMDIFVRNGNFQSYFYKRLDFFFFFLISKKKYKLEEGTKIAPKREYKQK